jgi:hypothetical protein
MTDFSTLNELAVSRELGQRLAALHEILTALAVVAEGDQPAELQPLSKHSIRAAITLAEECYSIQDRINRLLAQ